MRCHHNKQYRAMLIKEKLLEKNKNQNMKSFTREKELNYRSEILILLKKILKCSNQFKNHV